MWRWRIPRKWNRRRPEQKVGGGDHADGGGGFTGGGGELLCGATENGLGGVSDPWGAGGGYFGFGSKSWNNDDSLRGTIGGQGGIGKLTDHGHNGDSAGDGGIAGKGGNIQVSELAKIYAYNGDRVTNNDYTTKYYEYKADGTIIETEPLTVMKKINTNKDFIPSQIFAQNGILRAVYKHSGHWGEKKYNNYEYLYSKLGSTLKITEDIIKASESNSLTNVLIREEIVEKDPEDEGYVQIKSGYVNSLTGSVYGVGSGAGYIEISNGNYTVDENLN